MARWQGSVVMASARCGECPWQVHDLPPGDAALKAWQTHHDRTHSDSQPVHQLPGVDWHTQALQAIRALAGTGQPFVISQIIEYGVPDAPNPRTDYANVQREAENLGWIQAHGYAQSSRPTAKSSAVRQWIGSWAATHRSAS